MSEPLVLVILFTATPDPTAEPLVGAVKKGLGDAVVLTDWSRAESDDDALALGERVHSWAIVRVSWADKSFLRARLHVHIASSPEWEDEELSFQARDALAERGRTIGYALASMVQRMTRAQPPRPVDTDGEVEAESDLPPPPFDLIARPAPRPPTPEAPPQVRPPPPSTMDVVAVGVGALGGAATSGGGAAAIRWWPPIAAIRSLGVRAAVGARGGDVREAQASATTLFAAGGAGYRRPAGSSVELGVRSDLLVLQHAVKRSDGLDTTRVRWIGAADLLVEAGWSLSPHAGIVAAAGAELAFGTTRIRVAGQDLAELPPVRAVSELGLRFRF